MKAPLPADEPQRMMSLRKYDVLDTPPDQAFDDLARLASHICQTPIALVSLVDEKRQWFKSKIGMSAAETSRDSAFCAHTILHKDDVMEIRDAQADPRFVDNQLVTQDPHVRFYAGAPLVASDGHALGALCVMDRVPRQLTEDQLAALRALSRQTVAQLELQRQSRELANQNADRQWAHTLLRQQFVRVSAGKQETERLLAVAEKSRHALLSVLEDEKLAGESLLKSEKRFRSLFEYAPDGILIGDANSTYLDANESMCRMLGYTHDELVGKNATHIIAGPETGEIEPVLREIHSGANHHREWHFCRKDGSIFPADMIAKQMPDGNIITMVRDISERKRAEQSMLESAHFAQSTIDGLSTHLCVLDENGTILATNTAWRKFAGPDATPAHGSNIGDNYLRVCDAANGKDADHAAAFAAGIREVINDRCKEFSMEYPCHSPTEHRWFIGHVTRFPGDGPRRVVVAHENVTEMRKLESQFRQAQKMEAIGQLAGGIAHDFNNILAVIQIQSELLKTEDNLSEQQSGLVDEICMSVERGSALTRQVLLFSRQQALEPRELDLNKSVNGVTKILRRVLGEDIELQLKYAMQPLYVLADPGMLDQVLMNLAVNARDAMRNGGKLLIETSAVEFDESIREQSVQARPGSFVCLNVTDTGTGIPPEILPKIFEPFFTTKEAGKGTGLGLATVFGIVQQHKGWINLYSEVGRGTAFNIYLPRLEKIPEHKKEQPGLTAVRGGHETILLVEDDAFLRASVLKTLMQLGYRVLEAVNGVEALEIWRRQKDEIRLVLTDMLMPGGINGKQLGERLLQDNPKLKVIYASGYTAEIAGKDFRLKDGVNFLTKPFQAQKLARIIRENLDAP
jgi:PAS domain S-box-containing protein